MLQFIRNMLTGWFAVAFVAILIVPFAFFGINYYFDTAGNVVAVRVNGNEITLLEYQQAYQNIRQQWQQISPEQAARNEFIRQQTIDTLIDRQLLLELRTELGLRITDDLLRDTIAGIQAFRNPEGFDIVAYQNYLMSAGQTPAGFEAQVRQDVTMEQLQSGLLQSMIITRAEILRMARLFNQTRDIEYAVLSHPDTDESIKVTDEEIHAFYKRYSEDFMQPEQVRLAYILLSVDEIAPDLDADEIALRDYFEKFSDRYSMTERRKVRQLLVYQEDGITDEAREVAAGIYELLDSGLTFAEVQEQHDSEGDVRLETSDFGYLNKGVLDPQIDEVVFTLEKGVVSEPVRSEFGYHLLIVEDITGGHTPSFSEVREQVEEDFRREQAERQFFELYDELAILTYEHPETLEIASASLGLAIHESDFLFRQQSEEPLLNHPAVLSAAFSEEVLLAGNNSDMIELDQERVIVFRVIDHQPPRLLPLEEVRDEIYEELHFEKMSGKMARLGKEIIERLEQGADRRELAEEHSVEWVAAEGIRRDQDDLNNRILQTAFSQTGPGKLLPFSASGVGLGSGDYAVIIVDQVHEPDAAGLGAEDVEPVINLLSQAMIPGTWARLLQDMRSRAEIRIFEANL